MEKNEGGEKMKRVQTIVNIVLLLLPVLNCAAQVSYAESQVQNIPVSSENDAISLDKGTQETSASSFKNEETMSGGTAEKATEASNKYIPETKQTSESTNEKQQEKIKITREEVDEKWNFLLGMMGMDENNVSIGVSSTATPLSMLLLMIEQELSNSNPSGRPLGWIKGSKSEFLLTASGENLAPDDYEIEDNSSGGWSDPKYVYKYTPELVSKEGDVKYDVIKAGFPIGSARIGKPSSETSWYTISIDDGTKEFYSRDGTIRYSIETVDGGIMVAAERIISAPSTDSQIDYGDEKVSFNIEVNKKIMGTGIELIDPPYFSPNAPLFLFTFPGDLNNVLFEKDFAVEAPPKIKIKVNENNILHQNDDISEIDYMNFISLKDTMKETVGDESNISFEWINVPDTSQIGTTKGTIKVTEKYGSYINSDTAEVSFSVEGDQLTAEPRGQKISLGTDVEGLNLNTFVRNVKLGEESLTTSNYTTKLVGNLSTDQVGEQMVKVQVAAKSDPTKTAEVDVPVTVEWGNSIRIKGTNYQTITGLSLVNNDGAYTIQATRGTDDDFKSETINSKFTDEYLGLSFYKKVSGLLPKPVTFTFKGTDEVSGISQRTEKQTVGVGDILEVKHAEVAKLPKMISLYKNNEESIPYEQNDLNSSSSYYEITDSGFNLLFFNQLITKEGEVPSYTTHEYLDEHVKDYVDSEKYPSVRVNGFSEYPDTTTSGEKEGKIKVAEILQNGKEVEYEYTVKIKVTEGSLSLSVPEELEFEDIKLSNKEQMIKRKYTKPEGFEIIDSRDSGDQGEWYVTCEAEAAKNNILGNYLVYKTADGKTEPLTSAVRIYEQEEVTNGAAPLVVDPTTEWDDNAGVLLDIPLNSGLSPNNEYEATITFTIVAGP